MAVLVKSQYFAKKSHVVVVSTCGQGDTHLKLQLLKRYGELTSVQLNFTEFASEIVLIAVKSYFGEYGTPFFIRNYDLYKFINSCAIDIAENCIVIIFICLPLH